MERTFVYLKPNAVRRGLVGEIIKRFEQRGIKIVALKLLWMSKQQAEKLYEMHKGKSFYNDLIDFVTGGPIVAMIVEAPRVIEMVRHIIGDTDPLKAGTGTIRGEFALTITKNLIHASDSKENFEREYKIFFSDDEIIDYYLDVQDDI
ncbi:nucleoside diphosphate kinase [Thermosipho africanus H17ap60334]|jgi:nucleoside-diphosphate kinase|uniref:Nucleoside diphosphate kinase n=1 Tax=Thermosipho africanus (strain TCF52B) TaxID=484019 RepID=NDK_THEAB|nr:MULTISPECIES: nucleoside-diphosphate kinase [Thermosipho]B7IGM6.1 RecName: Full=Nucleoside diphosphate kinase; Short=NDK; Short=NDP kinase; AltName: Full=Nucleoside-2-P kinase [Thermosipho africanus TCF52B]ACJ75240.1 nucleoside diphosphate kinase [Thermosipho africanus TCF52B]EKF50311.1 nucleoside diphosphate kinase [Thermosipho africanus H17ap60334]MBZ4649864.1 nucleoside diphosphate kinase [Thermosipho sp. (in: thermotogales)]MDK2839429.1 nucleoside-diphosphate kinase [Thermosipho sp. (in